MGLLAGWLAFRPGEGWTQNIRLFLATGVLGGFTTFSAFSLDAVLLWERGATGATIAYVAGSVALSILGLIGGLQLIQEPGVERSAKRRRATRLRPGRAGRSPAAPVIGRGPAARRAARRQAEAGRQGWRARRPIVRRARRGERAKSRQVASAKRFRRGAKPFARRPNAFTNQFAGRTPSRARRGRRENAPQIFRR